MTIDWVTIDITGNGWPIHSFPNLSIIINNRLKDICLCTFTSNTRDGCVLKSFDGSNNSLQNLTTHRRKKNNEDKAHHISAHIILKLSTTTKNLIYLWLMSLLTL